MILFTCHFGGIVYFTLAEGGGEGVVGARVNV